MKVFLWIVGIVTLLVVGAGVYIALNLGDLIKTTVETLGSQALGTKVSIDDIDFSANDASAEIRGLSVANPAGYTADDALGVLHFKVAVSQEQPGGEVVVLRHVLIKGAHVGLEFQGLDIRKNSNLQKLLNNLNHSAQRNGETEDGTDEEDALKVIIDQLDFTDATATVKSDILGQIEIDVPDILLRDIGRGERGVDASEAIRQLLEPLIIVLAGEVAKKSTGLDVDQLQDQAESKLKQKFGDSLKKLVN